MLKPQLEVSSCSCLQTPFSGLWWLIFWSLLLRSYSIQWITGSQWCIQLWLIGKCWTFSADPYFSIARISHIRAFLYPWWVSLFLAFLLFATCLKLRGTIVKFNKLFISREKFFMHLFRTKFTVPLFNLPIHFWKKILIFLKFSVLKIPLSLGNIGHENHHPDFWTEIALYFHVFNFVL